MLTNILSTNNPPTSSHISYLSSTDPLVHPFNIPIHLLTKHRIVVMIPSVVINSFTLVWFSLHFCLYDVDYCFIFTLSTVHFMYYSFLFSSSSSSSSFLFLFFLSVGGHSDDDVFILCYEDHGCIDRYHGHV